MYLREGLLVYGDEQRKRCDGSVVLMMFPGTTVEFYGNMLQVKIDRPHNKPTQSNYEHGT